MFSFKFQEFHLDLWSNKLEIAFHLLSFLSKFNTFASLSHLIYQVSAFYAFSCLVLYVGVRENLGRVACCGDGVETYFEGAEGFAEGSSYFMQRWSCC
ncbi:hypothetical protein L1987_60087 [Smallanthus sonchifolius]|uniref:Uncharacterized protein n=1 Tax=Smallanthus sonchifolius TaxID=185202 RepID=A0ACB9D7W4_9ASTR|nr:hypothetical protein L1987_60087 [Smallanthus sonchifolius]